MTSQGLGGYIYECVCICVTIIKEIELMNLREQVGVGREGQRKQPLKARGHLRSPGSHLTFFVSSEVAEDDVAFILMGG